MLETMIPACFSQPNTASESDQAPDQNLITCIYQTQLFCNYSPTYLTLTWSKTHFSHTLTIFAPDSFSLTVSLNPSTFSFFRPKPSSKSIHLTHQYNYQKIKLYWDFSRAEFPRPDNSAEPESQFYLAIACNSNLRFFFGDDDLLPELTQRSGLVFGNQNKAPTSTLLSRREHVFGGRNYLCRAVFMGSKHEIGIECNGGNLKVRVDGELSLVVKRLAWKFRGNEKIFVGGVEVEFFWDVFNWVNGNNGSTNGNGHGVFVFQVGDGGVWPEMVGPEKRLLRKSLSSPVGSNNNNYYCANNNDNNKNTTLSMASFFNTTSYSLPCSSVLQWAEESSEGGSRSSCSSSTRSSGSNGGFSLLLYAWRKD